jgi:signal transduction histidine kinase
LRTKGLLAVALPVLPLACFWGFVALTMLRQAPPVNTTGRSLAVQASLARVFSALLDADAGIRDNVLTDNVAALERYRVAIDRIPLALTALDHDIIDPELRETLRDVRGLVDDELPLLARLAGALPPAASRITERAALDQSAALLEKIRALTTLIERRQIALAAARTTQTQRATSRLFIILLTGSIACTVGGFAAALVLVSSVSRRRRALAENAHRLARGEIPKPLPPGDDETSWLDERFREAARLLREREDEQRQMLDRLNQLNRALHARSTQLEMANRELESFSYSVSHDLRAPLRAIDGFSQAIQEDCADQLDDGGRDSLRRVRAAATRMGALIDDLLDLSRLTRMELRRQPVDVSAAAAAVAAELARRAPSREVDVVIAPDLSTHADPQMVRIALENLLDNAWKYTARTSRARIEIGWSRNGGPPVYHVRDNGAGFDMQYSSKLFGAFQRLHTEQEFPGTGIGLATVQRIIHRHGGQIWADGAVDRGASFYFTLEPEDAGKS